MYVQNIERLLDEAEYSCDYRSDVGLMLNRTELEELQLILYEWLEGHCTTVTGTARRIYSAIREYMEGDEGDD